ncbi:hypothetical protein AXF42_Ash004628 [Apostasia shenzhenica]|uniref:Uncharacterized protein n=1 Tax=Apostasia shenzhenica TaxID=1088818 RepID=A0A2I0BH65_9ASPA|nr:hypothetical protein AXF42_Ash004628 [Apostasia shenzhenica]
MDRLCGTSSPILPGPSLHLPASHLSQKLHVQKLKPAESKKRLLLCRTSKPERNDLENDPPFKSGKVFAEEAIGAEYGEGFETFRLDGPLKVDVDYLNESLQACFLQRIRHAMKPDEAFGLVFSWDNVVADTRSLKLDAWRRLAYEEGRNFPSAAHLQRAIVNSAADHVLQKVLCWEKDETKLEELKSRLSQLYRQNLLQLDTPIEGLREWLEALHTAGIPCAVVSSLDRKVMLEALERMRIGNFFKAVVTEEDGMESIAHRLLSASIKLDRKPSKCVVFEDDPRGIAAAHNCTMMAVALIGAHRAYELVQADLAVGSFTELSVINLRRLFAHKGFSFMDLQKQVVDKLPRRRKLMTDTIF